MRRCCFIEKRDYIILLKMISYCERIQHNLERFDFSYQRFIDDFMFQDACCMCVIQIGELAAQLSEDLKSKSTSIPWRIIKDTGNFYVHAYGNIDEETVWNTLLEDIPILLCRKYRIAIFPEYRQKHLAKRRSWVSAMCA